MVRKKVDEKSIKNFLKKEGFREIKSSEKANPWYKKASNQQECSKEVSHQSLQSKKTRRLTPA